MFDNFCVFVVCMVALIVGEYLIVCLFDCVDVLVLVVCLLNFGLCVGILSGCIFLWCL